MNDLIKSKLVPSPARIWPWMRIPVLGFIIGIVIYVLYIATMKNSTLLEGVGAVTSELIKVLLITALCLVILSIKYGSTLSRVLIFVISVYWGFIFAFFISASDYLTVVYLSIQVFSILWCISIGILRIKFIKKIKLAIIPFAFLALITIFRVFFHASS